MILLTNSKFVKDKPALKYSSMAFNGSAIDICRIPSTEQGAEEKHQGEVVDRETQLLNDTA